jgi:hypothetical protein
MIYDLGLCLSVMDQSNPPKDRKSRRAVVLMKATLELSGASIPVKLRNLSADGALVEAPDMPVEGSAVLFRRNELAVSGRVAWVKGNRGGIAFDTALSPDDVLRHVPQPQPRKENLYRRPGLSAQPLSAAERQFGRDWVWSPSKGKLGE